VKDALVMQCDRSAIFSIDLRAACRTAIKGLVFCLGWLVLARQNFSCWHRSLFGEKRHTANKQQPRGREHRAAAAPLPNENS
jgi:hypothetical protein